MRSSSLVGRILSAKGDWGMWMQRHVVELFFQVGDGYGTWPVIEVHHYQVTLGAAGGFHGVHDPLLVAGKALAPFAPGLPCAETAQGGGFGVPNATFIIGWID